MTRVGYVLAIVAWGCDGPSATIDPATTQRDAGAETEHDAEAGLARDGSHASDVDGGSTPDPIDEYVATLPARCTPTTYVRPDCGGLGATFDPETQHCRLGDASLGPFTSTLRAACRAANGTACDTDEWERAFLLQLIDTTGMRSVPTQEVIARMRERGDIYCKANAQDEAGRGIYRDPTGIVAESARSEAIYLPFVLGPRRQTDAMMRQLYLALPESVRETTAFVIADRLVQQPEAYARYVRSRERTVIVGSFVGMGTNEVAPDWVVARHADELWKLRMSIAFVHSLGREVADVVYAMGDSPTTQGLAVREALSQRVERTLAGAGLSHLDSRVGWGADEVIAIGMAQALPDANVRVLIEHAGSQHHYDGYRTTEEILPEKLRVVGLNPVDSGEDFVVAVFTRKTGGPFNDWQSNDTTQQTADANFLTQLSALDPTRLAIVDARIFNGAWDRNAAPRRCDLLAYGSWGTFGNVAGMTLAVAKILRNAPAEMRRQMYLEAVAHDVFANGYEEAQRGELRARVNASSAGPWSHYSGYDSAAKTETVFGIVNTFVNERMSAHFAGTDCMTGRTVRLTPQLWRTFESEVHVLPVRTGEVFAPGVYRTDLGAAFDPRVEGGGSLVLADLVPSP